MVRVRPIPVALVLALMPAGCASMSHTGKGATIGSAIGSGAGALVAAATGGNPLVGAAIGGVGGAGVGAVVGSEKDADDRARADGVALAQAEATARVLSVEDVKQMARPDANGKVVSDDVILGYIRSAGTRYDLSVQDIKDLGAAGVSDRVVQEMMATRTRPPAPPRTIVVREPRPVYVRDPYYDPYGPPVVFVRPPPPVGFGFSYNHYRRGW